MNSALKKKYIYISVLEKFRSYWQMLQNSGNNKVKFLMLLIDTTFIVIMKSYFYCWKLKQYLNYFVRSAVLKDFSSGYWHNDSTET